MSWSDYGIYPDNHLRVAERHNGAFLALLKACRERVVMTNSATMSSRTKQNWLNTIDSQIASIKKLYNIGSNLDVIYTIDNVISEMSRAYLVSLEYPTSSAGWYDDFDVLLAYAAQDTSTVAVSKYTTQTSRTPRCYDADWLVQRVAMLNRMIYPWSNGTNLFGITAYEKYLAYRETEYDFDTMEEAIEASVSAFMQLSRSNESGYMDLTLPIQDASTQKYGYCTIRLLQDFENVSVSGIKMMCWMRVGFTYSNFKYNFEISSNGKISETQIIDFITYCKNKGYSYVGTWQQYSYEYAKDMSGDFEFHA